MFYHIKPQKTPYVKGNLPKEPTMDFDLPALTCTRDNQGIACYMPRQNAQILRNVISVAANGDAPAFYQPHDFAILQDAYALRFKGRELSHSCYLYITALLQKVLQKYNWNDKSGWAKVSCDYISLPVLPTKIEETISKENIEKAEDKSSKENNNHLIIENTDSNKESNRKSNNEIETSNSPQSTQEATQNYTIAFSYMESFIKELETERLEELETERLEELETYLRVTGLSNYTLTHKEKEALSAFENLDINNTTHSKAQQKESNNNFSSNKHEILNGGGGGKHLLTA